MVLLVSSLLAAAAARADAAKGFVLALPPADQAAIGAAKLSAAQVAVLDGLVQRDVAAARQGDVVAFARGFSERRTPDECHQSGIAGMTSAERERLDAVVAQAIADRPLMPFVPSGAGTPLPAHVTTIKPQMEVHGQVSLFYGAGSRGASWYGGSVDAFATDPSGRFTIGVGYSEVHTRGMRECLDRGW